MWLKWIVFGLTGVALAVSCKNEAKKQGGGATTPACPVGYVYNPAAVGQTTSNATATTGQTTYTGTTTAGTTTYSTTGTTTYSTGTTTYSTGSSGTTTTGGTGWGTTSSTGTFLTQSAAITWQNIQPVVQSRCANVGCHNSTTRAANIDLSTYALTKAQGAAVVSSIATRKTMPKGGASALLSAQDQQNFLAWQQGGFLETATNATGTYGSTTYSSGTATGTTGSTTTSTTWQNIQPIMAQRCSNSGCHDAISKAANIDLSTFLLTKNFGSQVVSSVAIRHTMPKGQQLSTTDQQLFLNWQAGGFLEIAGSSTGGTGYTTSGYNTTIPTGCVQSATTSTTR